MTADPDAILLARLRTDDREAFAVLVARHIGVVQAACRRQAAPGEEDDCVQAVFLILARKPAAAARAPLLAAWLLRVAWYVCRNARRMAGRRRQAEVAAATAAAAAAPRPEALDHLDDCLLRLPERQRAAVTLHYLAGRSAEEVAASLGTSRDNAYQLISRGLAGLRQLLARRGVAIAGAGLASLLAAEAQAAGAAATAAQAATITSLAGTPSAGVAALSTGAMHAMTIAAATPFAAVASLLLGLGTTAVLLTAESTPPPPAPAPATPAASAPAATAPAPAPAATAPAVPAPAGTVARQPAPPDLAGHWNDMDNRVVAQDLATKILADPWLAAFTEANKRKPRLLLGRFVIRAGDEAIATAVLRDAIERQLLASGRIAMIAMPAEGEARPEVDVTATGSLNLATAVDGTATVRTYTIAVQGVGSTGEVRFNVATTIRKEIEKSRWK